MHTEQEPGSPPPVPRPARARPAPREGGLTLTRLVLAAGALLFVAYFIGNRRSATLDSEGATTSSGSEAQASSPPRTVVIQGEKSTTLTTVDEARMSVLEHGQVLRIEGGVGKNFAHDLRAALDANPSMQRIDITSGGGYAGPGLEAARMISRRNLIVRVHSHCASMCVALWAAGAQRQMEPDAMIGLHQWNAQCDARPSPEREECRVGRCCRADGHPALGKRRGLQRRHTRWDTHEPCRCTGLPCGEAPAPLRNPIALLQSLNRATSFL